MRYLLNIECKITNNSESGRAWRSSATVLRHASPASLILDRDGSNVDAMKISLVDEGKSGSLMNRWVIFVPRYLKLISLI